MKIKKDNSKIKYLYHYTPKENIRNIISSGVIKSKDNYTFFTKNYYKSIALFENEMMSNNYYISIDKELKTRSYANPEDYRIIKIPYYNDGKFIKMIFDEKDRNNIYYKSTIHEGELYFNKEEVEVLDIPIKKGYVPYFGLILKLSFLFTMFIQPIKAKADTWIDSEEYYDISWWNGTEPNIITIDTPEKLAGVLYLNQTYGYTFSNTTLKILPTGDNCSVSSSCFIDMSAHDWVPFKSTFTPILNGKWQRGGGILCGYHRIILKSINQRTDFIENNICTVTSFDTKPPTGRLYVEDCEQAVVYHIYHSIHTTESTNGTYTVNKELELKNNRVNIETTPNEGYILRNVLLKQKNGTETNANCNTTNNSCYFNMPDDEVTVQVNFIKKSFNIYINENDKISNIHPNDYESVEYLDEQEFEITPIIDYDFIGYKINDGELIPVEDNRFTITNVTENMWIELITKPTKYSIENNSKDNKYIFKVDKDFSEIKKIKVCLNNNCKSLKKSDYSISNKTISINNTFMNKLEEGDYELQVTFANQEEASSNFRLTHVTETPTIINNPKTKTNFLILFIIGLLIPVFMGFKKKREDSE